MAYNFDAYEELKDRLNVALAKIQRLSSQELVKCGSIEERNACEQERLRNHGHEREEIAKACEEVKAILANLGLA